MLIDSYVGLFAVSCYFSRNARHFVVAHWQQTCPNHAPVGRCRFLSRLLSCVCNALGCDHIYAMMFVLTCATAIDSSYHWMYVLRTVIWTLLLLLILCPFWKSGLSCIFAVILMGLYIVHVRASRQRRCVPSTLTNNFAVSPSFAFSSKHFLVVHYVGCC